jgi:hypothetical protein
MTTTMLKLKGTLHLGDITTGIALEAQVTNLGMPQTVTRDSPLTALDGTLIQQPAVYSYVVSGQILLDDKTGGVFDFIHKHQGEVMPFTLSPATPSVLEVAGTVTNDGLSMDETESGKAIIGKFAWPVNGTPTWTFATAGP